MNRNLAVVCLAVVYAISMPKLAVTQQVSALNAPLPSEFEPSLPNGVSFRLGTPILRTAEHIGGGLILAPSLEGASSIINHIKSSSSDSNLIIEALIFLPTPRSDGVFDMKSHLEKLGLLFNAFSSLQGIQYWSGSRKIMRTFYTSAYRIDNPKDQKKIQDPSTVDDFLALLSRRVYVYQKDQTFDGIVTEVQSSLMATTFLMTNTNVTPLRLIGIPVLPADGIRTGFLAAPSPEGVLLYFVTSIKSPIIGRDRVFESSSNKALALLHWFINAASSQGIIAPADIPWNIDDLPPEARLVKTGK